MNRLEAYPHLEEMMKKKGVTARQIAEMAEVSRELVHKWLTGEIPIPAVWREEIWARFFPTTNAGWLFEKTYDPDILAEIDRRREARRQRQKEYREREAAKLREAESDEEALLISCFEALGRLPEEAKERIIRRIQYKLER